MDKRVITDIVIWSTARNNVGGVPELFMHIWRSRDLGRNRTYTLNTPSAVERAVWLMLAHQHRARERVNAQAQIDDLINGGTEAFAEVLS